MQRALEQKPLRVQVEHRGHQRGPGSEREWRSQPRRSRWKREALQVPGHRRQAQGDPEHQQELERPRGCHHGDQQRRLSHSVQEQQAHLAAAALPGQPVQGPHVCQRCAFARVCARNLVLPAIRLEGERLRDWHGQTICILKTSKRELIDSCRKQNHFTRLVCCPSLNSSLDLAACSCCAIQAGSFTLESFSVSSEACLRSGPTACWSR
mmetsp:Transcript_4360/g.12824  ORF Transcript_4360/g.12824 Transcript_4360/m.12824 type:complete len:209 (+) Transcript_4360:2794-3420(+)